jgi:PAS domain S-box-containing protein
MAVRLRVILAVFLLTGAVVAASTFVTYWFGNRVLQAHAREQLRRDGMSRLDQLESIVKDAETGQRGFIITGDETYLQPFEQASRRLPADLDQLHQFLWIDVSSEEIGRVTQLVEQKMEELRNTIELRRTQGLDAAVPIVQAGSGKQTMDLLRGEIGQLKQRQIVGLAADGKFSDETTRTRTLVFVFCGVLNLAVFVWAYRRMAEALSQRDLALREASIRGFELQQQKDLLSVTLSSIGDCVMVTDKEGRITFMNPVAERVTGWKLNEARGRSTSDVFKIINEHTRAPAENPVEKVMKQGVVVGLANHTVLISKDGTEIPIDDSGAPIRDGSGRFCGVVLVFRDFSERKQAERDLRAAKEAAETANRAKDQFLAMLSHELRTPLTPVLATLNLWEASEDVPQALQPDVQMLRRSIEMEARIIDDLLDLTRIARGMLSFSPESTDVHAMLNFLVGLSQSEAQNKDLNVDLDLKANRHHVHSDAARLQQVIWNILRNAIKFTDNGGQITITTTNDSANDIAVAVRDNGIGMTPETISKLFVPFEQADPSRNRRYGGLGLGMAISSALVELLQGKLEVESPGLGKGSTFTVTFPTSDPAEKPRETTGTPSVSRGKVKLLLLEDHADTARALSRLLENRGYRTQIAPTVAAALEAVDQTEFDLLLCDLGLPDGTGMDFIGKIRRERKTPAIALTGFGMQQDVDRARQAGFDAHLTKPVNMQKLEATIWQLLRD